MKNLDLSIFQTENLKVLSEWLLNESEQFSKEKYKNGEHYYEYYNQRSRYARELSEMFEEEIEKRSEQPL